METAGTPEEVSPLQLRIICTACNVKVRLPLPPPERSGRCPKCGKTLFEWKAEASQHVAPAITVNVTHPGTANDPLAALRAYEAGATFRSTALAKSWECLQRRDFYGAGRIVAEYESRQVHPRGINVNWQTFPHERDLATLKLIFERTPQILAKLPPETVAVLRLDAAMMNLWGACDASDWDSTEASAAAWIARNTNARMLLFHASNLQRLREYKAGGLKTVLFSCIGDDDSCAACSALDGKIFTIGQAPELPLASCTSEDGCRCSLDIADSDEMLDGRIELE